jgi:hypothetical protein
MGRTAARPGPRSNEVDEPWAGFERASRIAAAAANREPAHWRFPPRDATGRREKPIRGGTFMGRKARLDLVLDCSEPEQLMEFWRRALDYRVYYSDSSFAVLVPDEGSASPLVLQQVPEPKAGKNRMHLDIVADDIETEIKRLQLLGARRLHDEVRSLGDTRWITLADPENNEFCVCTGVEW